MPTAKRTWRPAFDALESCVGNCLIFQGSSPKSLFSSCDMSLPARWAGEQDCLLKCWPGIGQNKKGGCTNRPESGHGCDPPLIPKRLASGRKAERVPSSVVSVRSDAGSLVSQDLRWRRDYSVASEGFGFFSVVLPPSSTIRRRATISMALRSISTWLALRPVTSTWNSLPPCL